MLEMNGIIEAILLLCGPVLAVLVLVKLAPVSYLIARGGHDPTLMYFCMVGGSVVVAASFVGMAASGAFPSQIGGFFFSTPVIIVPICVGAAAMVSTLPYWLVRIFRPTGAFFESLDHALAPHYDLSRYTDPEQGGSSRRP